MPRRSVLPSPYQLRRGKTKLLINILIIIKPSNVIEPTSDRSSLSDSVTVDSGAIEMYFRVETSYDRSGGSIPHK